MHVTVPAYKGCAILLVCTLLWVSTHCSCIAHSVLHTTPQWVSYNGGLSRASVKASLGLSFCHRGLVDLCTRKLSIVCVPHILSPALLELHANTHAVAPRTLVALKHVLFLMHPRACRAVWSRHA